MQFSMKSRPSVLSLSPHQHSLKFPKEDEFPRRFLLNSLQAPSDMGFSRRAAVASWMGAWCGGWECAFKTDRKGSCSSCLLLEEYLWENYLNSQNLSFWYCKRPTLTFTVWIRDTKLKSLVFPLVVGRIMVPQRCLGPNPWNLWLCHVTWQWENLGWQVELRCANQLILRWRDYPGSSGWDHCKEAKNPQKMEKEEEKLETTARDRIIAGFEDRRVSWAKEWRQPLEAGKGKKMDSPLEPPEVTQPCRHHDLNPKPSETHFRHKSSRTVR